MIEPINTHAVAVLLLTAVALVLFARKHIPLELTSLFVLSALLVGFTLFPYADTNVTVVATNYLAGWLY